MALIDCKFFSETLEMCSSMRVILPESPEPSADAQHLVAQREHQRLHPTLYLLHGLSDDESVWTRLTSIERYVAPLGLAVVMPNVHRSFYTNMRHGYRYWDFVSRELVDKARQFFPLSSAREDNVVAGLSMGGYGAFKLALTLPERFAAAASLSGVADVTRFRPERVADYALIFGEGGPEPGSEHDLFALATRLAAAAGPRPRLYQCCGTEDFLLAQNRQLQQHLAPLGLDYHYQEGPGGHDWAYWDAAIAAAIGWLVADLPRAGTRGSDG